MDRYPPYRNGALFLALAAMWGVVVCRDQGRTRLISTRLFAAFRYDLAAVLLFAYAFTRANRVRPHGLHEWIDVVVSGLFIICAFQALLFIGQQYTTSAIAAILVCTSPILVTAFSRLLLPHERLSMMGLVGLAVGFVGVYIVTHPDPEIVLARNGLGELLIVLSVACFAFGSVLIRVVEADVSLSVECARRGRWESAQWCYT